MAWAVEAAGDRRGPEGEPVSDELWMDLATVARYTGWTTAYVSKRASLDGWATRGTKPQQYSALDVAKSVKGRQRDTRVRDHLSRKYGGQG